MAYSELIKNFGHIRDYMRQFYIYGFKSREEYGGRSARSYDNERRRVESWLGDYMAFRQDESGKAVFLSIDSRSLAENPLYQAFRAKSFTAKDITLHFCILDLLADGASLPAGEIVERIARDYLSHFEDAFTLDESTVRKKLKEYEALGLLVSDRRGREVLYRRAEDGVDLASWAETAAFFSEADPLGVVGAYLLDKLEDRPDFYRFKHHYILHALDSEVLWRLLDAIDRRRAVELTVRDLRTGRESQRTLCPLRIYVSTQTGRQYLLGYCYGPRRLLFYRLDAIERVKTGDEEKNYAFYAGLQEPFRQRLWGVSTGSGKPPDHIEMTVRIEPGEAFIVRRLEREKRCGTVERLDEQTCRFTADVYDAMELLPWLRTFTGRIVALRCSEPLVERTFLQDLAAMERLYGGGNDAVQ